MKTDTFFVVSEWNNKVDWVENYTDNYLIYDKSNTLPDSPHIIRVPNVGHNLYDIFLFCYNAYNELPDTIAFLEGNPFDHINLNTFNKLIYNKTFTALEDYSHVPESYAHHKDVDGGYMEINSSWYLSLPEPYQHKHYNSYDDFMDSMFFDYVHLDWIRFAPGGQYIVPKENILKYSRNFYKELSELVSYAQYTCEAQLLERCLYYIFSNTYTERILINAN